VGLRNFLIEGVSGAGKTTVAEELQRRGYHVLHGDRTLAYLGDPDTGEQLQRPVGSDSDLAQWQHEHWIWNVGKVRAAIAAQSCARSFFCGGSRNHHRFIELFDGVFVLQIDKETLDSRLAKRPANEFGGAAAERMLIARLHATGADMPASACAIDAMRSVCGIVDDILKRCEEIERSGG
jgi:thymidylate kinase